MINSFNLLVFLGGLLVVLVLPLTAVGGAHVWFIVKRRADTSPAVLIKALWVSCLISIRLVILPILGISLILNGWRLDPILQFPAIALSLGIGVEAITALLSDYYKWRYRLGRASANINVDKQPSDIELRDQYGESF